MSLLVDNKLEYLLCPGFHLGDYLFVDGQCLFKTPSSLFTVEW